MNKCIDTGEFRRRMKIPSVGIYLFFGEENFIKYRELCAVREKVCEDKALESFNHFVLTKDNFSPEALTNAAMSIPMGVDLKLIEIYELPLGEIKKSEEIEAFKEALQAVADSGDSLLIIYTTPENFDSGKLPKHPSSMYKMLSEYAVPVAFNYESDAKLCQWLGRHFAKEKIIAGIEECQYLLSTVGHDMSSLTGEIEKLSAYIHFHGRERLQKGDIDLICPKNKEIGEYDFANAILNGNPDKAFYILAEMKLKNEDAKTLLGSVTRIYTDMLMLRLCVDAGIMLDEATTRLNMNPYTAKIRMQKARQCDRKVLEELISLCQEAVEALKSFSVDDYLVIERLIVKATAVRKRKARL